MHLPGLSDSETDTHPDSLDGNHGVTIAYFTLYCYWTVNCCFCLFLFLTVFLKFACMFGFSAVSKTIFIFKQTKTLKNIYILFLNLIFSVHCFQQLYKLWEIFQNISLVDY